MDVPFWGAGLLEKQLGAGMGYRQRLLRRRVLSAAGNRSGRQRARDMDAGRHKASAAPQGTANPPVFSATAIPWRSSSSICMRQPSTRKRERRLIERTALSRSAGFTVQHPRL